MEEPDTLTRPDAAQLRSAALTARGHAVIEVGNHDGEESVAVWQVTPEGEPSGAWVVPAVQAFGDRMVARRLLVCAERRALVSFRLGAAEAVVARLSTAAEVEVTDDCWSKVTLRLPDLLSEVAHQRKRFEEAVAEEHVRNKNITALEWRRRLPGMLPSGFEGLEDVSGIAVPPGSSVTSQALLVSRLLHWLMEVWAETEQTKGRRAYIHHRFGPPTHLPSGWMELLTTAYDQVLPL